MPNLTRDRYSASSEAEFAGRMGYDHRLKRLRERRLLNLTLRVRRRERDIRIVDIAGEIDIYSSEFVRSALSDLIDDGHLSLIVNLEKVRYIDSIGLGILITSLQRVRVMGGRLDLVCTNPIMCKLFDLTGLAKAINVFRDEHEAVGTFAGPDLRVNEAGRSG